MMQAMEKASEKGIIYIEGSGPTYATHTVCSIIISKNVPFLLPLIGDTNLEFWQLVV